MKKKNTTSFFQSAEGQMVVDVQLAENDRIITLLLTNQTQLVFHLFGNHPNIFLARDGIIQEAFKSPATHRGSTLPQPREARPLEPLKSSMNARQAILATDTAFPRHLIQPIIRYYNLSEKTLEECREVTLDLQQAMLNKAEFRVLEDGNICLIPFEKLPVPTSNTFDTISEAIRFAYYKTSGQRRLSAKKNRVEPALERTRKKFEQTITQLQQSGKALERSESYEQFGHLLMSHAHEEIHPGTKEITLSNFYDENRPVRIPLQANKSLAENAQHYYKKSTDAIRNAEESERRLQKTEKALKQILVLETSFNEIQRTYEFDDWMNAHEEKLQELGVLSSGSKQLILPFRKILIDGHELWIGKSAKSNDKLTSMAHKEDIWLHARGVSGSHVVIRMNNNKEMAPKSVLLKAAAIAAWNSKARGSALAPVIITKRKYIVKPKGAPAGAVRVTKENVEMVQPQTYKTDAS